MQKLHADGRRGSFISCAELALDISQGEPLAELAGAQHMSQAERLDDIQPELIAHETVAPLSVSN